MSYVVDLSGSTVSFADFIPTTFFDLNKVDNLTLSETSGFLIDDSIFVACSNVSSFQDGMYEITLTDDNIIFHGIGDNGEDITYAVTNISGAIIPRGLHKVKYSQAYIVSDNGMIYGYFLNLTDGQVISDNGIIHGVSYILSPSIEVFPSEVYIKYTFSSESLKLQFNKYIPVGSEILFSGKVYVVTEVTYDKTYSISAVSKPTIKYETLGYIDDTSSPTDFHLNTSDPNDDFKTIPDLLLSKFSGFPLNVDGGKKLYDVITRCSCEFVRVDYSSGDLLPLEVLNIPSVSLGTVVNYSRSTLPSFIIRFGLGSYSGLFNRYFLASSSDIGFTLIGANSVYDPDTSKWVFAHRLTYMYNHNLLYTDYLSGIKYIIDQSVHVEDGVMTVPPSLFINLNKDALDPLYLIRTSSKTPAPDGDHYLDSLFPAFLDMKSTIKTFTYKDGKLYPTSNQRPLFNPSVMQYFLNNDEFVWLTSMFDFQVLSSNKLKCNGSVVIETEDGDIPISKDSISVDNLRGYTQTFRVYDVLDIDNLSDIPDQIYYKIKFDHSTLLELANQGIYVNDIDPKISLLVDPENETVEVESSSIEIAEEHIDANFECINITDSNISPSPATKIYGISIDGYIKTTDGKLLPILPNFLKYIKIKPDKSFNSEIFYYMRILSDFYCISQFNFHGVVRPVTNIRTCKIEGQQYNNVVIADFDVTTKLSKFIYSLRNSSRKIEYVDEAKLEYVEHSGDLNISPKILPGQITSDNLLCYQTEVIIRNNKVVYKYTLENSPEVVSLLISSLDSKQIDDTSNNNIDLNTYLSDSYKSEVTVYFDLRRRLSNFYVPHQLIWYPDSGIDSWLEDKLTEIVNQFAKGEKIKLIKPIPFDLPDGIMFSISGYITDTSSHTPVTTIFDPNKCNMDIIGTSMSVPTKLLIGGYIKPHCIAFDSDDTGVVKVYIDSDHSDGDRIIYPLEMSDGGPLNYYTMDFRIPFTSVISFLINPSSMSSSTETNKKRITLHLDSLTSSSSISSSFYVYTLSTDNLVQYIPESSCVKAYDLDGNDITDSITIKYLSEDSKQPYNYASTLLALGLDHTVNSVKISISLDSLKNFNLSPSPDLAVVYVQSNKPFKFECNSIEAHYLTPNKIVTIPIPISGDFTMNLSGFQDGATLYIHGIQFYTTGGYTNITLTSGGFQ